MEKINLKMPGSSKDRVCQQRPRIGHIAWNMEKFISNTKILWFYHNKCDKRYMKDKNKWTIQFPNKNKRKRECHKIFLKTAMHQQPYQGGRKKVEAQMPYLVVFIYCVQGSNPRRIRLEINLKEKIASLPHNYRWSVIQSKIGYLVNLLHNELYMDHIQCLVLDITIWEMEQHCLVYLLQL